MVGLVTLLTGCDAPASQTRNPATIALQAADVAGDLHRCANSGSIDSYLMRIAKSDSGSYKTVAAGWHQLQKEGAVEAAMVAYAARAQDCGVEPGAGAGRAVATLVSRFKDDRAAAAAYVAGIMGFPPPAEAQQEPGLRQGIGTQLGAHAWTLDRTEGDRVLSVAYWQHSNFTIYFVGVDLDTVEAKRLQLGVDARVG